MKWHKVEKEYRPTEPVIVYTRVGILSIPTWRWLWSLLGVTHWGYIFKPDERRKVSLYRYHNGESVSVGSFSVPEALVHDAENIRDWMHDKNLHGISGLYVENEDEN